MSEDISCLSPLQRRRLEKLSQMFFPMRGKKHEGEISYEESVLVLLSMAEFKFTREALLFVRLTTRTWSYLDSAYFYSALEFKHPDWLIVTVTRLPRANNEA